jgi:dihydroxyacetone kinase
MPGFSLTLLLLPNGTEAHSPSASDVISLLDERPQVLGWKWTPATEPLPPNSQIVKGGTGNAQTGRTLQVKSQNPESFVTSIRSVANALIAAEPDITRMDLIAGDGDAGLTLKVPHLSNRRGSLTYLPLNRRVLKVYWLRSSKVRSEGTASCPL